MKANIRLMPGALNAMFCIAVMLSGCESPVLPEPSLAAAVRTTCPLQSSDEYYFPKGTFGASDDNGREESGFYSRLLRASNAVSVSCDSSFKGESYRLLWAPLSIRGVPAIVELDKGPGGWSLTYSEFVTGQEAYKNPLVEKRSVRAVTDDERQAVLAALKSAEFWIAPTWISSDLGGGGTCLLEARRDSGFHVVSRHAPKGSLKEACRSFFVAAGSPVPALLE